MISEGQFFTAVCKARTGYIAYDNAHRGKPSS